MTVQQEWEFKSQNCRSCNKRNFKVLGFRGGEAHRDKLGVKCRIVKCKNCHLIYPEPMPYPKGEDKRYSDVDNYFNEVMKVTDNSRESIGIELINEAENMLGYKGSFLDIGCGRGEIVKAANRLGWKATGCDISEQYVEYAINKNNIEALTGTVEELNFPEHSFDFISLVEVIEHLYQPRQTISEVHRILKKNGVLYLSTPNEESIYQTFGNLYYKLQGKDWVVNLCPTWNLFHILGFSPKSIKIFLEKYGFEVEKIVVYSGTLVVPRRSSFWGKIESLGIDAVERISNFMGKSPYMYVWARKI